jgi:hypothetical protein
VARFNKAADNEGGLVAKAVRRRRCITDKERADAGGKILKASAEIAAIDVDGRRFLLAELVADHHKAMTTAEQVEGDTDASPKARDTRQEKPTVSGNRLYKALEAAGLVGVIVGGLLFHDRSTAFPTTDSGSGVEILDMSKVLVL